MRTTAAFIPLVLLCVAWLHASADEPTVSSAQLVTKVRLTTDRIEYSGIITNEANAGAFALYAGAQPKPTAILIESQGGSASAGLELGSWIFENGLDVEIDTYCFSSCANYVFPAGRRKLLAPRASLMWHGGVTQPITAEELGQVLESTLADMSEREGYYVGWDYSLDDMARLGVRDIEIKGARSWAAPVCPIVGQQIYRLRLDDLRGLIVSKPTGK